ncbi:MAG: pyruvate kinase, partial [Anaerolineaceae bacterium]
MRRTKIVCTLGPASSTAETISAMVQAGMDVVRLNTSHGTMDEHLATVKLVRAVALSARKQVGILMDLAGPKLRTGETQGGRSLVLDAGARTRLTNAQVLGTEARFSVEYPRLTEDVSVGDRVLLDDGKIELAVAAVSPEGLDCDVIAGGVLGAHKGVSFPNTSLTMPALTGRDQEYLKAGVAAGVDFFALSFVRDADDIVRARSLLAGLGADTPIIAKIERRQA